MATTLRVPGLLLGAGLGGFIDGIVLHQLLQWHHTTPAFDAGDDDTSGVDPHAGYDPEAVSGDTPEYRPER